MKLIERVLLYHATHVRDIVIGNYCPKDFGFPAREECNSECEQHWNEVDIEGAGE